MADAATVLREAIVTVEREVSKRRQALPLLTGAAMPAKNPAVKRPPAPRLALQRPAAKRRAPRLSTPAPPPLAVWIGSSLSVHKGTLFAAAQVTEELGKTDQRVKRDSVRRRFSELGKHKKVQREDGRYGVG
jgi:hypothetical protein